MTDKLALLFSPIKVGTMNVPNRIAETTHWIRAGRADGLPDDGYIAYSELKARNGVGWIANQSWFLDSPRRPGSGGPPATLGARPFPRTLWDRPDFHERVRRFCDAIHQYGSVVVMQLTFITPDFGPSPVVTIRSADQVPHELEVEEIQDLVQQYAKMGLRFREAGVDGVEIHAGHQCMPEQFFSPLTNKRTDEYGGSLENRTRFCREILAAIKASAGKDFTVGMSLNADQFREGGYTLDDAIEITKIMANAGLDFVDVDAGYGAGGFPSYIQPMYYPLANYANLSAAIREAVTIPVLFRGRVNDPILAEKVLADGHADIVGMCRASIADPEFPRKAREGQFDEIRKCVGCNFCIELSSDGILPVPPAIQFSRCAVNPRAGREVEWAQEFVPAQTKKRVVIVGGGPAGLECARVAHQRGHNVTLLEKNSEVGGQILMASKAPAREGFLDFTRYHTYQARKLGIDIRLGAEATADSILALKPDAIVLATGSTQIAGDFPGAELPNVVLAWDVLENKAQVGQKVVVTCREAHLEGLSVADFLTARGKSVDFLFHWTEIAHNIGRHTKGIVYYRLYAGGARPAICTDIKSFDGKTVTTYNVFTGEEGRIEGVDTVVVVHGSKGDNSLHRQLKDKVKEIYLIGSAYRPRGFGDATREGAEVARLL